MSEDNNKKHNRALTFAAGVVLGFCAGWWWTAKRWADSYGDGASSTPSISPGIPSTVITSAQRPAPARAGAVAFRSPSRLTAAVLQPPTLTGFRSSSARRARAAGLPDVPRAGRFRE